MEESCVGDHHGNLTGGEEAIQPSTISEMVEATGPTDYSSTILSPHSVCVCVCVSVMFHVHLNSSSKAAEPELTMSNLAINLAVFPTANSISCVPRRPIYLLHD